PTWHRHIVALHRQSRRGGLLFLLLLEPVPGCQLFEVNIHVTPPNREDSVISFACSDEHCATATSPDRLISAFHTLAPLPSSSWLASDQQSTDPSRVSEYAADSSRVRINRIDGRLSSHLLHAPSSVGDCGDLASLCKVWSGQQKIKGTRHSCSSRSHGYMPDGQSVP